MIPVAANATATLQQRLPMIWNGPGNPRKLLLTLGGSTPHLVHVSVGPPESSSKAASRSVQPFYTAHHSVSHYFTMGHCAFLQNCPIFFGGLGPPFNIGPNQVIKPNGISISSAVFLWVPNAILYNAVSVGKKTPKIAASHWDCVTLRVK